MPKLTVGLLDERQQAMKETLEMHDKLLIRGEGPNLPPLVERVRDMEAIFKEVGFWMRTLVVLFAGQFVAVLFTLLYGLVKILPILLSLRPSDFLQLARIWGINVGR